jgi:uncharacterized protein
LYGFWHSIGRRLFPYTAAVPGTFDIVALLVLGLVAGALGGLLGIGGSIIMIPVLTVVLQRDHQLSQAVAMIVNVFVALPAMFQHHRAKAVRWDIMARMLPAGILFIMLGVEASNHIRGEALKKLFAIFLIYMIGDNVHALISRRPEPQPHEHRIGWWTTSGIGGATGFMAGLLGIGGGNVAVPLLQRFSRLPLRQCIATTAAFMCVTASIGAVRKNLTLSHLLDAHGVPLDPRESLRIAAILAPTAVLGGLLGGRLTHALPLNAVRVAFILLLVWASAEMLGLVSFIK